MDEATRKAVLTAVGRGHLVYRPKYDDYVTSVGMVKVDKGTLGKLFRDELLEAAGNLPGTYRLSRKGRAEVANVDATVSG